MGISNTVGVALCCLGQALVTIFVILRLWVRWRYLGIISASDGFIVLSWFLYTYLIIGDVVCEALGQWQHRLGSYEQITVAREYYKNDSKVLALMIVVWSAGGAYFATLYCVKAAFLFFYFVLFPKCLRKLRIALHITSAICLVSFFVTEGLMLFGCRPIRTTWTFGKDHCEPYTKLSAYYFAICTHLLTDALIYILPFVLLPHLQLKGRKRLGVMCMFLLGFFNICVGIIRVVVIGRAFQQALIDALAAIEMCTAIMVVCSPPLKWLICYRGKALSGTTQQLYYENRKDIRSSAAKDVSVKSGDTWLTDDIEVLEWGTYVSKSRKASDTPRVGRASSAVDPDMEGILVTNRTTGITVQAIPRRDTSDVIEGVVAKLTPLAKIESGKQQLTSADAYAMCDGDSEEESLN